MNLIYVYICKMITARKNDKLYNFILYNCYKYHIKEFFYIFEKKEWLNEKLQRMISCHMHHVNFDNEFHVSCIDANHERTWITNALWKYQYHFIIFTCITYKIRLEIEKNNIELYIYWYHTLKVYFLYRSWTLSCDKELCIPSYFLIINNFSN